MKRNVKRHAVVQPLDQSYRYIPLTKGLNAIVDADDYEYLSEWNWHVFCESRGYSPYAFRTVRTETGSFLHFAMHREVIKAPRDKFVDHRNGNGLDNRKANLRLCTNSQNQANRRKQVNGRCALKGITRITSGWVAQIWFEGKRQHLGVYKSPEEAHEAYKEAALRLHGEFARFA